MSLLRPKNEPILITCVGSGAVGHQVAGMTRFAMCPMCGHVIKVVHVAADRSLVIARHDRDDILARLERGDFE